MTPEEFVDAVENNTVGYSIRFRPQHFCPISKIRWKLTGDFENYSFERYYAWDRQLPINQKTLLKIFGQLHYLSEHAPLPVQAKWQSASNRFSARHLPSKNYYRWADRYTPCGWI
jgi:hypothetical protein